MQIRRIGLGILLLTAGAVRSATPEEDGPGWLKGNLHTHSFWSDGDDYPERIVDWYKRAGYDFLAISDHNTLAEGERFIDPDVKGGEALLEAYKEQFPDWVDERHVGGRRRVRLRTLEEYRELFEEPGRFLLLQSEEISDRFEAKPIHVNATNIGELIEPQGGTSVADVMQRNVDAVLAQRERLGRPMFPHINHPNFGWAVKVEDLIALDGEKFFEVYNGHPAVHNQGDALRPSTERMWDILLAERLTSGREVMYGIAVDDAHNYRDLDGTHSNPGRGWVMVRGKTLTPEAIIEAMERGDFYGSSGVTLHDVRVSDEALELRIRGEEGVSYLTRFIGTRRDYDRDTERITLDDASVLRRYSDDIGRTLDEVAGTTPRYTFRGDEIYVRAKVISTKLKENPYHAGEYESAWVQPVVVSR